MRGEITLRQTAKWIIAWILGYTICFMYHYFNFKHKETIVEKQIIPERKIKEIRYSYFGKDNRIKVIEYDWGKNLFIHNRQTCQELVTILKANKLVEN